MLSVSSRSIRRTAQCSGSVETDSVERTKPIRHCTRKSLCHRLGKHLLRTFLAFRIGFSSAVEPSFFSYDVAWDNPTVPSLSDCWRRLVADRRAHRLTADHVLQTKIVRQLFRRASGYINLTLRKIYTSYFFYCV